MDQKRLEALWDCSAAILQVRLQRGGGMRPLEHGMLSKSHESIVNGPRAIFAIEGAGAIGQRPSCRDVSGAALDGHNHLVRQ